MRRRIAAAAVIAVGLMLALAACTFAAPQATLIHYDPSDGVGATVGSIELRNAFVISPDGEDANLIGAIINTSDSTKVVHIQYKSYSSGKAAVVTVPITLAGGETITWGSAGVAQEVLRGTNTKPGALLRLFIQYGNVSGKAVLIPVLAGTQSYYKGLIPTPTPTPIACSITNTGKIVGCPGPTESPTPTPTPSPTTTPN